MSKGTPIKIIGGKYAPANGWLDNSRNPTECFTAVIVTVMKGGRSKKEKATRVLHENYVLRTELKAPTSYEEAMMDQLSDVDLLMNKMVKKMAECELISANGQSAKNLTTIFLAHLEKAIDRQSTKGGKAKWRRIKFT
jgi:hypothetical protein